MNRVSKTVLLLVMSATIVTLARGLPEGFHDPEIVDRILSLEVPAMPFHFRVHDLEHLDDAEISLIDLSSGDVKKEKNDDEDKPVVCETICKPMEDEKEVENFEEKAKEASKENKKKDAAAERGPEEGEKADEDEEAASFLEIGMREVHRTLCEGKGGKWIDETGNCAPFMRATERSIEHQGEELFGACKEEFGGLYVPCSPYQALALAHMFDVPDHSYYWLWAGGRHDQVSNAVLKQEIGNNPESGLDKCPEEQFVGFFHNWDEAHVDSWGCLHGTQQIPVLCCRQN